MAKRLLYLVILCQSEMSRSTSSHHLPSLHLWMSVKQFVCYLDRDLWVWCVSKFLNRSRRYFTASILFLITHFINLIFTTALLIRFQWNHDDFVCCRFFPPNFNFKAVKIFNDRNFKNTGYIGLNVDCFRRMPKWMCTPCSLCFS